MGNQPSTQSMSLEFLASKRNEFLNELANFKGSNPILIDESIFRRFKDSTNFLILVQSDETFQEIFYKQDFSIFIVSAKELPIPLNHAILFYFNIVPFSVMCFDKITANHIKFFLEKAKFFLSQREFLQRIISVLKDNDPSILEFVNEKRLKPKFDIPELKFTDPLAEATMLSQSESFFQSSSYAAFKKSKALFSSAFESENAQGKSSEASSMAVRDAVQINIPQIPNNNAKETESSFESASYESSAYEYYSKSNNGELVQPMLENNNNPINKNQNQDSDQSYYYYSSSSKKSKSSSSNLISQKKKEQLINLTTTESEKNVNRITSKKYSGKLDNEINLSKPGENLNANNNKTNLFSSSSSGSYSRPGGKSKSRKSKSQLDGNQSSSSFKFTPSLTMKKGSNNNDQSSAVCIDFTEESSTANTKQKKNWLKQTLDSSSSFVQRKNNSMLNKSTSSRQPGDFNRIQLEMLNSDIDTNASILKQTSLMNFNHNLNSSSAHSERKNYDIELSENSLDDMEDVNNFTNSKFKTTGPTIVSPSKIIVDFSPKLKNSIYSSDDQILSSGSFSSSESLSENSTSATYSDRINTSLNISNKNIPQKNNNNILNTPKFKPSIQSAEKSKVSNATGNLSQLDSELEYSSNEHDKPSLLEFTHNFQSSSSNAQLTQNSDKKNITSSKRRHSSSKNSVQSSGKHTKIRKTKAAI